MFWIWLIIAVFVLTFGFVVFFGAPYVPSQRRYLKRAFDNIYKLGPNDVLVDVGSGDGIVLREAADRGARAIGYELNPLLVLLSKLFSVAQPGISIKLTNFWTEPLPEDTTIIYAFVVSRDVKRLIRKVEQDATRLGRPLRVLCFGSPLPIKPDKTFEAYALYTLQPKKA